jgi:hypothetical protein
MRFNDHVVWYSSLALEAIDVLREELEEQALLVQQIYKRVCYRRAVRAWI